MSFYRDDLLQRAGWTEERERLRGRKSVRRWLQ